MDAPEEIFLTDAFDDMEDGLYWVDERESDADTEYIRKDVADKNEHDSYKEGVNEAGVSANIKLQEILQPIRDLTRVNNAMGWELKGRAKDAIEEILRKADK